MLPTTSLVVLLLSVSSSLATVTTIAEYNLGETGSLGTNSRPLDANGTYSYTGNNYSGSTPVQTDGVYAPGSTHYLDTSDTSRQEGFWGPTFSLPGTDNFALGIYVRAEANTSATRGTIFSTGPTTNNNVLKISLEANGWAASAHNAAWIGTAGGTGFTANTWVHLAVIRQNGVSTLYIDRVPQVGTWSGTPVIGQSHMSVESGGSAAFDGHLDLARVVTFTAGETTETILNALSSPPPPEPAIVAHPMATSVPNGTTATFSVHATGDPAPTYQWFRNPGNIAVEGATSATLTIPAVFEADEGDYYAVATNPLGTATSNPATLTVTAAPVPSTTPSAAQQAQMDRKYGMFCHFGINTFVNQEWTDGTQPATVFNPTALDADQWVLAAKAAGMRYLLLITKHHDGFCLWPSAHTSYDVASSSRPDLDVVKSVSEACQRHGLRFAIYYSLWDRNWNNGATRATSFNMSAETSAAYLAYMKNQLTELLTNYGPVAELWLDGAWVAPRDNWHIPEVYEHVKSLQPECQMSVNWTVGPEPGNLLPADQQPGDPFRYFPADFRTADPYMPKFPDPKTFTHSGNTYYLPFEATITISAGTHWFYNTGDLNTKSLSFLQNSFDNATTQRNLFVINCAPNRDGVLLPSNVTALSQLAYRLGLEPDRPFPVNLANAATTTASSEWSGGGHEAAKATDEDPNSRWSAASGDLTPTLTINFDQSATFDRIIANEYGENGVYRCQSFVLETSDDGSTWSTIHTGGTLGESIRIDLPTAVTAKLLRLRVITSSAPVSLWMFKVHNSGKPDATKTSYQLWQQQNFTLAETASGIADANATPWGDGVPNFLKFALGIGDVRRPYTGVNPVSFSPSNTGGWNFSFPRVHRDVNYIIEKSGNLTDWEPVAANPGTVGATATVHLLAEPALQKSFFRLRATE